MPPADLFPLDLAPHHLALLRQLLAQHTPGAEVWAYGSRVNGTAHEGSDLDLVLRNRAKPTLPVEGLATLREALSDSMLPMLVDAHDWASLPESFHRNIVARHVVIQ